jgi:outer membrane protein assembly factor BamB
MLDVSGRRPKALWKNDLLGNHFSSSIHLDGFLYGIDAQAGKKGSLRCLSVKDGSEQWSSPLGHGSLIAADGQLIVLTDDGTLRFVKASPKAYEELAAFDTGIGKRCWTAPVLANGVLYCRNDKGRLVAIKVL